MPQALSQKDICAVGAFLAKGHIRVGYSVASALITPLAHYQPFAKRRNDEAYDDFSDMKNRNGAKSIPTLEQATGVEPATAAWEAAVLPLNYACKNG